jgi:formyl-CoA transferase
VALLDSMLFQSTGYLTLGAMGVELPRLGNEFRIAAPANTYACRDGRVMAGVLVDAHWKQLARVIGRPELADDADYATSAARLARRAQVDALIADWMSERSVDEVVVIFAAAGLPLAPVRSYAEAARDPHVHDREMLQTTALEDGTRAPIVAPAAKLSRTPIRVRSGAPALGAHNREILEELGIDDEERGRLERSGIL